MIHVDAETMQHTLITSVYDLPDVEGYLAIRNAPPSPPRGELRAVDLNSLIEAVYIAPTARASFKEIVEDMCKVYVLERPVFQSGLNQKPVY